MFEFDGYDRSAFTPTVAPLSTEQLIEYNTARAEQRDYAFLIDYSGSSLKGKTLLNYLANVEIPFALQFTSDVDQAERFDVLRAYMEMPVVLECPALAMAAAHVLLEIKEIESPHLPLSFLSRAASYEFIEANADLVSKWAIMMDSIVVYTMSSNRLYTDAFEHPRDQFPQIDDARIIGKNFVNLLYITPFLELYFSEPGDSLYYFTKQFEDPIFSGKHLGYYFNQPKNILPTILMTLSHDDYDMDMAERELEQFLK